MSGLKTFGVILKRISDGLTIQGNLADGKVSRQSTPYSADTPGKTGQIVFESFHKGSGQRVSTGGESKYNVASAWDATRPGHVRSIPEAGAAVTLDDYSTAIGRGRAEIFTHLDAGEVIVTPQGIFEDRVLVDTAPSGYRFTGSYAVFGDRIFFGMEATDSTRESKSVCRVRTGLNATIPFDAESLTHDTATSTASVINERDLTSGSAGDGPGGSGGGIPAVGTLRTTLQDPVSRAVYSTPSYTPTAESLVVAIVKSSGGAAGIPTGLAGNALTWVLVASVASSGLSLWRSMGAAGVPTADTLDVTFAAARSYCWVQVVEIANVTTTGANGADAVIQAVTGTDNTPALAAFADSANATFAAFFHTASSGGGFITPTAPMNELSELSDSSVGHLESQWYVTEATPGATASGVPSVWAHIALEVEVQGASSGATVFTTESAAPAAGALQLISIHSAAAGAAAPTSVTGCGLTWVSVDSQTFDGATRRLSTYRALGTPTPGPLTITFAAAQDSVRWSWAEFPNVLTTGANGANAVGTPATATSAGATSLTVAPGFTAAGNGTYAAFATNATSGITAGTGFDQIHDVKDLGGLETQWKTTNDATADASDTGGNSVAWRGIAFEIIAASPIATYTTDTITPVANRLLVATVVNVSAVPGTPTLAGCGVAWTLLLSVTSGTSRLSVFTALGDAVEGQVAIDFAGVPQTRVTWDISQLSGIDIGDAIGVSASNSGGPVSNLTVTLPTFTGDSSGTFGAFWATPAVTPTEGLGFTELSGQNTANGGLLTEWKNSEDLSVDASGSSGTWLGVAFEILKAPGASSAYSDAGFPASYFAVLGSRLFRVMNAASYPKVSAAWTDETETSDPAWFQEYVYPTEQFAMDAANLAGNFVIAVGGIEDIPGEVVTLDVGGSFTNILPAGVGFAPVLRFLPFNGGQFILVAGPIEESLYARDVGDISPLLVHPVTDDEIILPVLDPTEGAGGFLAASTLNEAFLGAGAPVDDLQATYLKLDDESSRVFAHTSVLPPGLLPVTSWILGSRITTAADGHRLLQIVYIDDGNEATTDLNLKEVALWNGNLAPEPPTDSGATGDFLTSEYAGGSYGLKQLLTVQGRTVLLGTPDDADTLHMTLNFITPDGSLGDLNLPDLNYADGTLGGRFTIELPETMIGRLCSLRWDFEGVDTLLDVICPIFIDYVEVPNQRETVALALLAGSLQITRAGGFTKQSRADTLDNLAAAVQDPEAWTLEWWDDPPGSPSWTVLLESFKAQETEEQGRPGEGLAVVNLVVRQLNTTARVI